MVGYIVLIAIYLSLIKKLIHWEKGHWINIFAKSKWKYGATKFEKHKYSLIFFKKSITVMQKFLFNCTFFSACVKFFQDLSRLKVGASWASQLLKI